MMNSKQEISTQRATLIGALSILLWGCWPILALASARIPPFELLSIAFFTSFLLAIALRKASKRAVLGVFSGERRIQLISLIGVLGTNLFFLLGIKFAPAANVSVVSYTWPLLVVLGGKLLGWFKPTPLQLWSLFIGFVGCVVVINPLAQIGSVLIGYIFGSLGSLSWAFYCLARVKYPGGPPDGFAAACALAVPFCLVLHLLFEITVIPSVTEIAFAILIGLGPAGGANILWDFGIVRGDARYLAGLAFATPVIALSLLVLIGGQSIGFATAFGAVLVIMGAVLGREKKQI
jgi:drug/metabolite transporter (DMT)-like permease